ncbi:TPA: hypothetical protein ODM96_000071 [Escherichia coli]|nr:hypothetical protein [Escherichia coli]HCP3750564.1 hypothetical protein [Escherichia coli]HDV3541957.1 hypothetical protein [Escherichia coli]
MLAFDLLRLAVEITYNPIGKLVADRLKASGYHYPITDQVIRDIQATGVEKFANVTIAIGKEEQQETIVYAGNQALLFANQLREGTA